MLKYINFMETADDVSRTTIIGSFTIMNRLHDFNLLIHISSFSIAICDEYGAL